jgi:choline-glycine betaine transporter
MSDKDNKFKLRPGVIIIPLVIFGSILVLGLVNKEMFLKVLWGYFEWFMVNLGWFIDLGALTFVIFSVVLFFHPIGKIKFGGEDAKPEFSYWNWFAMSLCAGMAIGIVMWPPEALMHTLAPAQGMNLEPNSYEAMIWAMKKTFLHWTFTPYAIYVVCGIIIGYVHYNLKKPFAVSSALYPLIGDRAFGKVATIVDALTLFAITGGVAGSLGYGLMQLGAALDFTFGIEQSPGVWISIAFIIVASYTTSSVTGLNRGIRWLSDKNAWLFIGLLLFALIFGPTAFMLNMTTQSAGEFFNTFLTSSTFTDPFPGGDLWPQWWDMYWFTDWLSFAPIVGMFLARLCYGRTIRQFLSVNFVLPAVFGLIWFGVFGSLILHAQYFQGVDLAGLMDEKGMEVLMLKAFDFLPLSTIVRPIMILAILVSFVTLADSMTSTVSMLSTTGYKQNSTEEPPIKLKVFWGVLMGATAVVFLFNGGLEGIKVVKTIAGIPILFLELLMLIGFILYTKKRKEAKIEQQQSENINQSV